MGMKVGEEKDITLSPDQAYGPIRPELVRKIPKKDLGDTEAKEGMVLGMQIPGYEQVIPARVVKVEGENVTLDLNPPLAGKTLKFKLTLAKVE